MNENAKLLIACLSVLCFLLLTSCHGEENHNDSSNVNISNGEVYYNEFLTENDSQLSNMLKNEYTLEELELFFSQRKINMNNVASVLWLSEVHEKFPIEIIRASEYSAYKVDTGGYYYVFWIKQYNKNLPYEQIEPAVYFSSHISSFRTLSEFESIAVGVSTVSDVKVIDPYVELNLLTSNGIYSYSFLDNENVLEIEYYDFQNENDTYESLVVKELNVIPRDSSPSCYSRILKQDFPKG